MRPHRYRVYIKATPDEVWHGITDPAFTARYFHATAFTSSLEPGSGYRHVHAAGPRTGEDAVAGEVVECDPPRPLFVTWRALYNPAIAAEPPSRVEWTLSEAAPGLTRLDLVHGDLFGSPITWAGVKDGWTWILDGLKTLLETGAPLPDELDELPSSDAPDAQWHRMQGVDANNAALALLESHRAGDDDEPVLRAAYASAYHWERATGREQCLEPVEDAEDRAILEADLAAPLQP